MVLTAQNGGEYSGASDQKNLLVDPHFHTDGSNSHYEGIRAEMHQSTLVDKLKAVPEGMDFLGLPSEHRSTDPDNWEMQVDLVEEYIEQNDGEIYRDQDSYVWGEVNGTTFSFLNGTEVRVDENGEESHFSVYGIDTEVETGLVGGSWEEFKDFLSENDPELVVANHPYGPAFETPPETVEQLDQLGGEGSYDFIPGVEFSTGYPAPLNLKSRGYFNIGEPTVMEMAEEYKESCLIPGTDVHSFETPGFSGKGMTEVENYRESLANGEVPLEEALTDIEVISPGNIPGSDGISLGQFYQTYLIDISEIAPVVPDIDTERGRKLFRALGKIPGIPDPLTSEKDFRNAWKESVPEPGEITAEDLKRSSRPLNRRDGP